MATLDGRQDAPDFELLQDALDKEDASNSKESVDPLVYKLVRVEGDGTFVPATEDEVEHLMEDERDVNYVKARKKKRSSVNLKNNLVKDSPNSDSDVEDEDVTGISEPEDAEAERQKLQTKLEFLEVMLQRVNAEERRRLASVPARGRYTLNNNTNKSILDYSQRSPESVSHVLSADGHSQESLSLVNSASTDENAMPDMENDTNGSPPPQEEVIAKPDSNAIRNGICLDNLSIRELHEAFRRTFGRETSVKDKLWLKRRISAGLDGTHNVANKNILLESNVPNIKKQVRNSSIENRPMADQHVHLIGNIQPIKTKVVGVSTFESVGGKQPQGKNSSTHPPMELENIENGFDDELVGHGMRAGKRLRKPKVEYGEYDEDLGAHQTAGKTMQSPKPEYGSYDEDMDAERAERKRVRKPKVEYGDCDEVLGAEKMAGKRVRKPNRRYIEDSEVEPRVYKPRTVPAVRDSGHGHSPLKSRVTPPYWNGVEGMALVTRQDSIGGSGIQVPFVSRVRRGRPRKNCTSLMKYNSSGMAAKLVKKALSVRAGRCDGEGADMKLNPIVPYGYFEQNVEPEENSQNDENALIPVSTDGHSMSEPLDYDLDEDVSDDYVATVPTAKGGTRRKHHRAWTLTEVMKLVEGVDQCGAGRWSEIKRIAFSGYGHRTSVDLKDKWRNLLRASNAQQTNKEGKTQRKHASVPIPAPILARVRELAASHSRTACTPSSSSVSRSGRTVHKKQPV